MAPRLAVTDMANSDLGLADAVVPDAIVSPIPFQIVEQSTLDELLGKPQCEEIGEHPIEFCGSLTTVTINDQAALSVIVDQWGWDPVVRSEFSSIEYDLDSQTLIASILCECGSLGGRLRTESIDITNGHLEVKLSGYDCGGGAALSRPFSIVAIDKVDIDQLDAEVVENYDLCSIPPLP